METIKRQLALAVKVLLCVLCILVSGMILVSLFRFNQGDDVIQNADISMAKDGIRLFMSNVISDAKEGAHEVPKRYWIPESAETIPERDDSKYGTASTAAELQWLLEDAAHLLDGQETLFTTQTEIRPGTEIKYYLDDSMVAVCWQQILGNMVYTIAEVKLSDPSQFRRYLTEDFYVTPELAARAGAVIAISGDHYRGRAFGLVVNDGKVERFNGNSVVDSCFVDEQGNLIPKRRNSFKTQEELEAFIAENDISFSLSFGPALIIDGERIPQAYYPVGEIWDGFPRCAICQKGDLHYILVTTNAEGTYCNYPNIHMFIDQIEKFDVEQAYNLDGGKTGSIIMQDKMMNVFEYGADMRPVADMLIFATAVPYPENDKTGS